MFFDAELLNREPRSGIVGIDRRTGLRETAWDAELGNARVVALDRVKSVRTMAGKDGTRIGMVRFRWQQTKAQGLHRVDELIRGPSRG